MFCFSVDGGYSEFGNWSECSETCGLGGNETRTRTCTEPPPSQGGADCVGEASETRPCTCPGLNHTSIKIIIDNQIDKSLHKSTFRFVLKRV